MQELTTQLWPIQGKAKALIPEIQKSVTNAKAALSKIGAVTSKEEAEQVNSLLAKVRNTYKKVKGLREEMTKPLDDFKKHLMELENEIATTKGKDSEYNRVKAELDKYWNEVEAKQKAEQQRIEAEKAKNLEIERIKSEQISAIEMGIIEAMQAGENALIKIIENATLDNFDTQLSKLNYKPNLKPELFNKWTNVEHNTSLVSDSEFQDLQKRCFDKHYGNVNEKYIDNSNQLLSQYREKLEGLKPKLKLLAEANEEQKAKIERENASIKAKEEQERNERIEAEKKAAEDAKRDREAEAQMDLEFQAQVQNQSLEESEGVRKNVKYILEGDPDPVQASKVLANVIIHCVASEDFKGIYKLDKEGNIKYEDGYPVYIDGVADWLKQLAKINKDADIKGLKKVESVSSVVRS